MNPSEIPAFLVGLLRQMDAEASSTKDGLPIGLRWYWHHEESISPSGKKREENEDSWCRRLKVLLESSGIPTTLKPKYPGSSKYADLRLKLSAGPYWIEVKGAWTYNNDPKDHARITRDNSKKYLHGRPDRCVESDVAKLNKLRQSDASHVAALLIGFDATEPEKFVLPATEIEELERRAALSRPWEREHSSWPDLYQIGGPARPASGYRVRCWLWHRPLVTPDIPSA